MALKRKPVTGMKDILPGDQSDQRDIQNIWIFIH